MSVERDSGEGRTFALTDHEGGFRFQDLASGAWELRIRGLSGENLLLQTLQIDSDVELGDLTLD